jgi:HEAT repeat protein
VSDRFRLIYLKSTDLEKSKRDEPPSFHTPEEIPRNDFPSTESMMAGTYSTQAILKQAHADLEHPDPKTRILAIRYLENSDPAITLPLLQEVLFDKDPEVRIQALASVIKFKDSNTLPLLKKSLRDQDPRVRLLAIRGMFRMEGNIDLNILLQSLSDESPWVRRRLATLLGWGEHEGVFPIIMELCKDADAAVRRAALFSLTTLYPEECENRLVEAMTDSDPDIRKWAREALETMATRPRKGNKASLFY